MPHLKTLLAEELIGAEVHFPAEPGAVLRGFEAQGDCGLMEAKVREMMQGILADPAKSRVSPGCAARFGQNRLFFVTERR
ncbi:hypothetical protein ACVOMV_10845 [Mesorhizobium atlanticum]